jgi:superfamily II RNA helicase
MNLKYLKDAEFEASFHRAVQNERDVLHGVILHIQEVERRKLYLTKEFGSLFSYLTVEMRYSGPAAQRRIDAARLASAVSAVPAKIESGALNLSQLGEIQKSIKSAESIHQTSVTSEMKAALVEAVQNQSVPKTQQLCAEMLNIPAVKKQTVRTQQDKSKLLEITLSESQFAKFERARDLLAHKHFQSKRTHGIADVLETIFDDVLARLDPDQASQKKKKSDNAVAPTSAAEMNLSDVAAKTSVASENSLPPAVSEFFHPNEMQKRGWDLSRDVSDAEKPWRALTPKRKKIILAKQGCCQFKNPANGRVCGSTFNLHVDHIQPKWDNGTNDADNLRVLCREHNLFRYRNE